jgi:hypothetical protein
MIGKPRQLVARQERREIIPGHLLQPNTQPNLLSPQPVRSRLVSPVPLVLIARRELFKAVCLEIDLFLYFTRFHRMPAVSWKNGAMSHKTWSTDEHHPDVQNGDLVEKLGICFNWTEDHLIGAEMEKMRFMQDMIADEALWEMKVSPQHECACASTIYVYIYICIYV